MESSWRQALSISGVLASGISVVNPEISESFLESVHEDGYRIQDVFFLSTE